MSTLPSHQGNHQLALRCDMRPGIDAFRTAELFSCVRPHLPHLHLTIIAALQDSIVAGWKTAPSNAWPACNASYTPSVRHCCVLHCRVSGRHDLHVVPPCAASAARFRSGSQRNGGILILTSLSPHLLTRVNVSPAFSSVPVCLVRLSEEA